MITKLSSKAVLSSRWKLWKLQSDTEDAGVEVWWGQCCEAEFGQLTSAQVGGFPWWVDGLTSTCRVALVSQSLNVWIKRSALQWRDVWKRLMELVIPESVGLAYNHLEGCREERNHLLPRFAMGRTRKQEFVLAKVFVSGWGLTWFRLILLESTSYWCSFGVDVAFPLQQVSESRWDHHLCYSGQADFTSFGGTNQVICFGPFQPCCLKACPNSVSGEIFLCLSESSFLSSWSAYKPHCYYSFHRPPQIYYSDACNRAMVCSCF